MIARSAKASSASFSDVGIGCTLLFNQGCNANVSCLPTGCGIHQGRAECVRLGVPMDVHMRTAGICRLCTDQQQQRGEAQDTGCSSTLWTLLQKDKGEV